MGEYKGNSEKPEKNPGYESSDISVNRVIAIGLLAIILLAIVLFLLNQVFIISKESEVSKVELQPQSQELTDLRAREDSLLNSYKVLDAQKGIYQIPISRAMKLLADRDYQQRVRNSARPENKTSR